MYNNDEVPIQNTHTYKNENALKIDDFQKYFFIRVCLENFPFSHLGKGNLQLHSSELLPYSS